MNCFDSVNCARSVGWLAGWVRRCLWFDYVFIPLFAHLKKLVENGFTYSCVDKRKS